MTVINFAGTNPENDSSINDTYEDKTLCEVLSAGAPYAFAFGGQGQQWYERFPEVFDSLAGAELEVMATTAEQLLAPITEQLLASRGYSVNFSEIVTKRLSQPLSAWQQGDAAIGLPGVFAGQFAQLLRLQEQGFSWTTVKPTTCLGYSSGIIAEAYVQEQCSAGELFAIAQIIGAACVRVARSKNALGTPQASVMMAIGKTNRTEIEQYLAEFIDIHNLAPVEAPVIAIYSHRSSVVVSGKSAILTKFRKFLLSISQIQSKERKSKLRGGSIFEPTFQDIPVNVPYHHPLLADVQGIVTTWVTACGLNVDLAHKLTELLTVTPVDWVHLVDNTDVQWIVDLGPSDTLVRTNRSLIAGRGIGLVSLDTQSGFDQFFKYGAMPKIPRRWSTYAPTVSELPNGQLIVNTAFSRLTGRSPILLAGMTPTTVDPEIVAAAANAGFWAELAGGGQVTEAIFNQNLAKLEKHLQPGRTIQFNALYLDPYLWGLQFGSKRMVQRARHNGAPIDGMVVSAGIPDKSEAAELIDELTQLGIRYIAFKPGTVKQIKDVIAIAEEVSPTPVIVHIEGGKAGGHHSWEDLDDLLLATYDNLRAVDNIVICVGGGIANATIAARYLMGTWAQKYGNYPLMPLDGVLIGTIAMAAREATTSPQVKELLALASGTNDWVGTGEARNGVTSSMSQLGSDLHEIDNSWAQCGRFLDSIAGDEKAIRKNKAEIIAKLNTTAKPYFGDIAEMTYGQLLDRVVELMFGTQDGPYWLDSSWQSRFYDLINRIQARVDERESGTIAPLFPELSDTDDAPAAVAVLRKKYPSIDAIKIHPADQQFFIELCKKLGKPVPFVPVIDTQVRKWWRSDSLWQAHDSRYPADAVSIIPGPASLCGISQVNEPIADILGGIEKTVAETIISTSSDQKNQEISSVPTRQLIAAPTPAGEVFSAPDILWNTRLTVNPVTRIGSADEWTKENDNTFVHQGTKVVLTTLDSDHAQLSIPTERSIITVRFTVFHDGRAPQITAEDAAEAMLGLFSAAENSCTFTPTTDPEVVFEELYDPEYINDYTAVTTPLLPDNLQPHAFLRGGPAVPDAFIALSWKAMITALISVRTSEGELLAGELINLVHLDHSVRVIDIMPQQPTQMLTRAKVTDISDTEVGKVVTVDISITDLHDKEYVHLCERFAFRGFAGSDKLIDPVRAGGALGDKVIDATRKKVRQVTITAPPTMTAYASVSGDYNAIHTNYAMARFAGLDSQIVHGMWLSAACARIATAQDTSDRAKPTQRLVGWTARFLGMVKPEDTIVVRVDRVGIDGGSDVIEVSARVDGVLVMSATGVLALPFTAYIFPGQGIQRKGMGLDAITRSKAARDIWERADKHTRNVLGFSILTIVRDNPSAIVIDGKTYHHPEGVLYLTQFTQVAMSVLAQAQIAELTEAGLFNNKLDAVTCGHSVGEYNALTAFSGIIPFESLLEVVYLRGTTMHNLVERDEKGVSNYQMAAIRPAQINLNDDDVFDFVEELSHESGEFLQIVNYNIRGSQYAIAGTVAGIAILEEEVEKRRARFGGRPAFARVNGLDVPFHSRRLYDGVEDFRALLDKVIPEVDINYASGRYIPNLVARPFSIDRDFIEEIVTVVDSQRLHNVLDNYDEWLQKPNLLTKEVLVELLAWQFASPVRWIETQDLLFTPQDKGGYGVERCLEIGVAISPTLTNMARHTLKLPMFSDSRVELLNFERDYAVLWGQDTVPDDEPTATTKSTAPAAQTTSAALPAATPAVSAAPASAAAASAPRPDDISFTAGDALVTLIASWTTMRVDQISPTDTIESITDGASSRRNQLLIDLGAELNISSIDGAADATIPVLQQQLNSMAKNYKPFGTVLSESVAEQIRKMFGPAGKRASYILERVTQYWQLGEGWAKHVIIAIVLGTREGVSVRGGDLAVLGTTPCKDVPSVDRVIDKAVEYVARQRGISVSPPVAQQGSQGTIDVAALREFTDHIAGEKGVLAETARIILRKLNLLEESQTIDDDNFHQEVADLVAKELGSDWVKSVTPRFSAEHAIVFDDRWASAREDLARLWITDTTTLPRVTGTGDIVAQQALWWANKAAQEKKAVLADTYKLLAEQAANTEKGIWADDVAVITGASEGSIAAAITAQLLAGGATVIATTSQLDDKRRNFFRKLYHKNAAYKAKLWVLPANMSSYSDIDDLVHWIATDQSTSLAGKVIFSKPPMYPTLLFPFAAPRVQGDMSDAGPRAEVEMRVLLWAVERLITKIGAIGADVNIGSRIHVILPGSPNRGMFGGDGAYGEAKASLDAVVARYKSEKNWNDRITLIHAIIGWVSGTGLMGKNDALESEVEKLGIHTFSTEEIAAQLLKYAHSDVRKQAHDGPIEVDLTGGLATSGIDIAQLAANITKAKETAPKSDDKPQLALLPSPIMPWKFPRVSWPKKATAALSDTVVIVGYGEVGPYGSSRVRFDAEVHDELSAASIAELAWLTGLIYWEDGQQAGWYDTSTNVKIDELDIADEYRDKVLANVGIRKLLDDERIKNATRPIHESIFLDEEISFVVNSEAIARTFLASAPETTVITPVPDSSDWKVVRKPGTEIFVTRRIDIDRFNAGQVPEHFDPKAYGISAEMVNSIDRLALWNLVATVDAFISSGFDPVELLHYIHPADIANTQGTGMGGTSSIRKLYLHGIFGFSAANDILQESLPNVVSAHVVQSYIGSYGPMVHPVAACATAAVSIEEGVDKILSGKSQFAVAGGYDDLSLEGIIGFADMGATADSKELADKGISAKYISRANDRRRAGFVESQGGGTLLLTRGDVALEMGLPVYAVVAYAQSFGDGVHTSIPAPGLGALAAGRGRSSSRLAKNLAALGLTADDISVISKHDTSTLANDVNETHLHESLAKALGRTEGNPLFIVSQKTITGHAKGGAAAFQTIGLTQILEHQVLPPNKCLDCVDDRLDDSEFFVWLRETYPAPKDLPIRAGLLTSLGFGHVSGLIALVHPEAFIQLLPKKARAEYIRRAEQRVTQGHARILAAMYGGKPLYEKPEDRRFNKSSENDDEIELLLSEQRFLDSTGHF